MNDELTEIFRRESGRCTAGLIRVLGDVDLAEDAVAEAFAVAAEQWPVKGVPPNPGGWITTTAKHRAIDRLRRESTRDARQRAAQSLHAHDTDETVEALRRDLDGMADALPDDRLRLIFLCCHPALHPDAQVALTLRLVCGLETAEISRAFLVPEPTLAQRLVRAKRKLRENHAAYRVPPPAELPERLRAVLAVIHLVFNEGHRASSGDTLSRVDLCAEGIRLGRVLSQLMPDEPEVSGLLALMLLTDARRAARTAPDGSFVPLAEQDRSRWDRAMIAEGHELVRACIRRDQPGPYQLTAAIAAVHDAAPSIEETDWAQVLHLYDHLLAFRPDDVVRLNRAVAVTELHGPEAGLAELSGLAPALDGYQPFHATRAELLRRLGDPAARDAFDRAIALTDNSVERRFLTERRDGLR